MTTNHTNTQAEQQNSTSDTHQNSILKSKDIYEEITNKIIQSLENGVAPWVKPWATIGAPRNAITGREYSGINTILLAMTEFSSNQWLTFQQAKQAGGNVKKSEKGTTVVFFKTLKIEDKTQEQADEKIIPMLKTFTVFNTQQIENLPAKFTESKPQQFNEFEQNPIAEFLLLQAEVNYGSSRACFIPSLDKIQLPNKTDFKSNADFYATALHELTHWTGHKARLNRDFSGRFGDKAYAFEELVAELGAAFLCSHCEVNGQLQHDSYIASWLKVLKSDKKAIFTASSKARQATEFLTKEEAQEEQAA